MRPFINIVEAERRHAQALIRQCERLGFAPRVNRWAGKVAAPATLREACAEAIAAEVDNIALHDRLLPDVADPQVRGVLGRLQEPSRDRHLPAFRRCPSCFAIDLAWGSGDVVTIGTPARPTLATGARPNP